MTDDDRKRLDEIETSWRSSWGDIPITQSPVGWLIAQLRAADEREKRLRDAVKFILAHGPMVGETWTRLREALK